MVKSKRIYKISKDKLKLKYASINKKISRVLIIVLFLTKQNKTMRNWKE